MYQKRMKKLVKKGSNRNLLREARRQQRLQLMMSMPTQTVQSPYEEPSFERVSQNRIIFELAWKTISLMHRNKLIQQKIIALQKETSEFIANVMSNPDNLRRYQEQLHGLRQIKVEPLSSAEENELSSDQQ